MTALGGVVNPTVPMHHAARVPSRCSVSSAQKKTSLAGFFVWRHDDPSSVWVLRDYLPRLPLPISC